MRAHVREKLQQLLGQWFKGRSLNEVLSWCVAAENRRIVIVVGAGFSRNARWADAARTDRPVLPSWRDVDNALAREIGLAPGSIDGLLLADLHSTDLGAPKYHHTLLGLVPDDDIVPGRAHRSLFNLRRPEAVVTTNQLDTLLDRGQFDNPNDRWFRVIEDSDLAQPRAERAVQLLYLHGHRTNPGRWIFRSSDYQDLDQTRPVMMRRVRQLLAQHPVLFVGFSLTDPNFHALARQVNREMRQTQPHALTVMLEEPPLPFVKYWEKLCIRFAVMAPEVDPEAGFEGLFRSVEAIGRDRPPKATILEKRDILTGLAKCSNLSAKLEFLRSVLEGQDEPGGRIEREARSMRSVVWDIWLEAALPSHLGEREKVLEGPQYEMPEELGTRYMEMLSPESRSEAVIESKYPFIKHIQTQRFRRDELINRVLDWNVGHATPLESICEWLSFGLEYFADSGRGDSRSERYIASLCNACAWSWTERVRSFKKPQQETFNSDANTANKHIALRAHATVARCLQVLERRDETTLIDHVVADLKNFESTPKANTERDQAEEGLRSARESALDGKFSEAYAHYCSALNHATRLSSKWHEWLAVRGLRALTNVMRGMPNGQAQPTSSSDWRAREQELERSSDIVAWTKRTDRNTKSVLVKALQRAQAHEIDRHGLTRTITFEGRPALWRQWKELDAAGASPWDMTEVLETLIAADCVAQTAEQELLTRLRFDARDTAKWLEGIALSRVDTTTTEAGTRDRCLAETVLRPTQNRTTSHAQLQCATQLRFIIQADQLLAYADFLRETREAVGLSRLTYSRQGECGEDYARSWSAFASLATTREQTDAFQAYVRREDISAPEGMAIIRSLGAVDWTFFALLSTPRELLEFAFYAAERFQEVRPLQSGILPAEVALELRQNTRMLLSDQDTEKLAAHLLGEVPVHLVPRRTYLVARLLGEQHLSRLLEEDPTKSGNMGVRKIDVLSSALLGVAEQNFQSPMTEALYSRLCDALQKGDDACLVEGGRGGVGKRLARSLAFYHGQSRSPIPPHLRKHILECVTQDPHVLSGLVPVLKPAFWEDQWHTLCHEILRLDHSTGDYDESERINALATMLSMYLRTDEPVPQEWHPCLSALLARITEPRAVIANNVSALAAEVVSSSAIDCTSWLWQSASSRILQAAEDPRCIVRVGPVVARARLLRSNAEAPSAFRARLESKLAGDHYAFLRRVDEAWTLKESLK